MAGITDSEIPEIDKYLSILQIDELVERYKIKMYKYEN